MEKKNVPYDGAKDVFREWLDMMVRRGMCALNDMESVGRTLPEIYSMLGGSLRKNHGDTVMAHIAIKSLRIAASVNGRMDATKFFFEDLEECLRHRRKGIKAARLVIRVVLYNRGRIPIPRSLGALRHHHFRQASSSALPVRLAA